MSYEDEYQGTEVTTLDAWTEIGVHSVTLPTGARVKIRIPDIADLIESGELPQQLLDAALALLAKEQDPRKKVTKEDILREREFSNFLLAKTLVAPAVTPKQASGIPTEDKEMLAQFALRLRDLDALGEQIAGLTKSEKFRRFRRLGEFDPALEGLS